MPSSTSTSVSVMTPLQDPSEFIEEQAARQDQHSAEVRARVAPFQQTLAETPFKADTRALEALPAQAEARMKPVEAEADNLGSMAKQVESDQQAATKQYQSQVKAYDATESKLNDQFAHVDAMAKNIAANSTVRDFWADKSTGYKIGAAIFQGLGAFGNGPNQAVAMINSAIERDLSLQRVNLANKQDNYKNSVSLLGQMRAKFNDNKAADRAAYLAALQGAQGRLQSIAASTNDLNVKRAAEQSIAEITQQTTALGASLKQDAVKVLTGQNEALLNSQVQLEHLGSAANGLGALRAATASENVKLKEQEEARKSGQEDRKVASRKIPGWHPIQGAEPYASDKEIEGLRKGEATTVQVTRAMSNLMKSLDTGKILSLDSKREYDQAKAQLLEAARGEGFGQTGSRLTETLKELETEAFTPDASGKLLARVTPAESKKLIRKAQQVIWQTMMDKMKERNLAPDDSHEFVGK